MHLAVRMSISSRLDKIGAHAEGIRRRVRRVADTSHPVTAAVEKLASVDLVKSSTLCMALIAMTLTFANSAAAEDASALINVQFGVSGLLATSQYTGPGIANAGTNQWNLIANSINFLPSAGESAANIPLFNAAGGGIPVRLSYSTPDAFYNASTAGAIFDGTPQQNLLTSYLYADAHQNGFLTPDGPGTVMLSGLRPQGSYEVIVYSVADVPGRATTFSVGGALKTIAPNATPVLSLNQNFAEFVSTADASGILGITFAAGGGPEAEANLNGLQLLSIPQVDPHALVNVQFGVSGLLATPQYSGPGVLSGGANQWNLVANTINFLPSGGESASGIALSDADGAATPIKLNYSTPDAFYNASTTGAIFDGTPQQSLLTSYLYADAQQNNPFGHDGPGVVTLSGLIPGQPTS
jgi:hypothetical protein